MSFKCAIKFGGDNCKDLLSNHNIVTVIAMKSNKVIDEFNATIEDLVDVGWMNSSISERTAYLKLKTHLAQKLQ
jgi:hypothetical protein